MLISLRLAESWALPTRQWHELDRALDRLSTALADRAAEAIDLVWADLIDLAPKRATPLGDEPVLPAPEPVRERINEMIHRLVDAPVTSRHPADSPAGSVEDSSSGIRRP